MRLALRIHAAGPGVTLQDDGRRGYLRFGVSEAGPMDRLAHATANLAVGASSDAAAIEVSLGGVELEAEGGALAVAVAGGRFAIAHNGRTLPPTALVPLVPGERLSIRPGAAGAWCYVAVSGVLQVPSVLGSVSTHTRTAIGGLGGRTLAAGDVLQVAQARTIAGGGAEIVAPWLDRSADVIRVLLGPQDDYFGNDQIAAFLAGPWTVSPRSDRMAYLLDGPRLTHSKGFNVVSDGIALGAIQVPGEGRPVVLMADRQPTGGYPKIATVIGPDLGRLAQLRAGAGFRFAAVSWEEAVAVRNLEADALVTPALEPLVRREFPSEFLLGHNLIDGVTSD